MRPASRQRKTIVQKHATEVIVQSYHRIIRMSRADQHSHRCLFWPSLCVFQVAMLVTTSRLSPVVHPAIKRLPLTESRPLDATMAQSTPVTPRAERPAPAPGVPWEQRQSIIKTAAYAGG